MRWFPLMVICAVLATTSAGPEPKKYKSEVKTKEKSESNVLTDEERKFLREVEEKFGVKPEVPLEDSEESEGEVQDEDNEKDKSKPPKLPLVKPPFPAVIAIEIVNDTDTKSKGKRTIDANLGYGYRTNNGYTYTYFGKPAHEKGKFMIYPYSQEDIPPANPNSHPGYSQQLQQSHGYTSTKISPSVEITPSQAYELVPTNSEETSYNYEKPAVQLKTKYEEAQSIESPPPPYTASETPAESPPSSTLYTTYNGKEFSSLSGQFPQVMSNYLVDPSQLVNNPQYQGAGLTQDHLRSHGANLGQRVVPVLVLRIPSSYIKNPTAELYANLPQNYPLSQYLNHLNLQQLVNEYFKKIGYSHAPQVMAYPSSSLTAPERHVPASVSHYEPQQYASPYVQPAYTHADYSGVQYSAVQPVMARYPSGYQRQQYYTMRSRAPYPLPRQRYLYMYRYIPPAAAQQQSYYSQQQHQQQQHQPQQYEQQQYEQQQYQQEEAYQLAQQPQQQQPHVEEITIHEQPGQTVYRVPAQASSAEEHTNTAQDEQSYSHDTQQYEERNSDSSEETATPEYEHSTAAPLSDYGPTQVPDHNSHSVQVQYEQNPAQKETVALYHRSQTGHNYDVQNSLPSSQESYSYQNVQNGHSGSDLVLTENYPSKDHTIATVLPLSLKSRQKEAVQSVSYVTPEPTMKFHSKYRVMVPQMVLNTPTSEKVAYVNSHSLSQSPYAYSAGSNSEEEYTVGQNYVPPVGKQRPASYPYNYHAHVKRITRNENKADITSTNSSTSSPSTKKSAKKKSS